MTEQTHREGVTPRSGDSHIIDPSQDHAAAVNVDAIAREEAAKAAAAEEVAKGRAAALPAPAIEEQADADVAAPRGRGR